MSATVEYDTGPLSWVKSEIDHALQQTRDTLSKFRPGEDDPAQLRNARTYLNQVSGAIEMVGLQGVALVSQDTKKLLEQLENQSLPVNAAAIDLLQRTIDAICIYLDDLVKGKPNLELRLFPLYQEIRTTLGIENSAESDLFFPDLSQRAPKTQSVASRTEAELTALVKKSRVQFQRGLLAFLRQQNADQGLAVMRVAVHEIEQAMELPANRTLWWGATAFVDCLANHAIEPNFAVKQLCGRIDLQMRRLAEGSNKVAERLLKDILYFVAKSGDVSDHVKAVKEAFSLDHIMPDNAGESGEMAALMPLLKELRNLLAPAKESWLKFTAGNRDSLVQFQSHINTLHTRIAELKSTPLLNLLTLISEIANSIGSLASDKTESLGLEMATALLLIQNTLENYQNVTGELVAQADVQMLRLRAAAYGDVDVSQIPEIPLLDEMSRRAQERLLIAQVAQEIQSNLKQAEEVLDAFFRDPEHDRQTLVSINAPLTQVQGALSILQLDQAGQLLSAARNIVSGFQDAQLPINETDFAVLADALSSLGLFIDALRHQRSDADTILLPALQQLGLWEPEPDTSSDLSAPSVEDSLDALKLDVREQHSAWQEAPEEENAQKKFLSALHELEEDAELIGDYALKQQTTDALKLADSGPNPALSQAIQEISGSESAPHEIAVEAPADAATNQAIDAELLEIFLEEAGEVLDSIASHLEISRAEPHNHDSLTTLRRNFHTLKGSGRMVGLTDLGEVAWSIEQLLNQWLQDEKSASDAVLEVLSDAHVHFDGWIKSLKSSGQAHIVADELVARATQLRTGELPEPAVEQAELPPAEQSATPELESAVHEPIETVGQSEPAVTDDSSVTAIAETDLGNLNTAEEMTVVEIAPPEDDRISIGTNLISAPLLDIFLREAEQHHATLRREFVRLQANPGEPVAYDFMRAAHTLAGIAGTTGFTAAADLAHALEAWLTQLQESVAPLPSDSRLTDDTITALGAMLDNIRAKTPPVPAHELIAALEALQTATLEYEAQLTDSDAVSIEPVVESGIEIVAGPADTTSISPINIIEAATDIPHLNTLLATADEQQARRNIVDDLDDQLLPIFLEEAAELMPKISAESRNWRANPTQGEAPASLQRLLHTLKGSARMAGAMRLGELTHVMETHVVNALESGALGAAYFDEFEIELDRLNDALNQLLNPEEIKPPIETEEPQTAQPEALHVHTPAVAFIESESRAQMLRIRADTVDRLVNEAGEISITRSRLESSVSGIKQNAGELAENIGRLRSQLRELEIQAESQMQSTLSHMQMDDQQFDPLEFDRFTRLQELTRMIAESINDVGTVQQNISIGLGETEIALTQQGRMTRDLQQALMHIRIVPLSSIADRLHRTVRRAAKDMGKKASLQIIGEQVEIDRSVLEKMVAPFEHLLRNAVAHGLELPADRVQAGKSEYGEIVLHARQEGNEVMLSLRDDGRGLDLEAIRTRAIAKDLLQPEIHVAPNQLMQFIFAPGFSTAETVTELSGRGIGMDVVKSEITGLGGRLEVSSETGKGAQFMIYLPLTLAVTQTVLIKAADHLYALPSTMVEQVQEYKSEALAQLLATGAIEWQGNRYSLFYLPHLLGQTEQAHLTQRYNAVILLRSGMQRCAILVDDLIGNREVVVKNIGPQLARVSGIAGATVLGNGQIVLILNPVQLALRQGEHTETTPAPIVEIAPVRTKVVMVVDDSLTVRKITGRLLAREGYEVITAKDGLDALQMLQDVIPDVMLLDIEMPRMDGFELTKTMRADTQLAGVPIIMITSRTADKHRDHAMSLGVNAYLGKPFQEEELLAQVAHYMQLSETA
ncbi:signal transduction histidine kinase CheA [Sulfuriferula multivorans]|uniref:Chemotaxis protein CheA n=1 Tax=Sulfuriferula multivorans TaxID=1559896 RepID=A0A401J9J3_9PROT|nr:Hpt domain-containing protein [Sulfuriferula multivorans]GBL44250.1 signal transduction histidine kinase CheA [Sulfuriferula multivorans]